MTEEPKQPYLPENPPAPAEREPEATLPKQPTESGILRQLKEEDWPKD